MTKENINNIDILKFTGKSEGESLMRYAHSYIGIGITPNVGNELNKTDLNPIKELIIAARVFFTVKYTKLKINNKVRRYFFGLHQTLDAMLFHDKNII